MTPVSQHTSAPRIERTPRVARRAWACLWCLLGGQLVFATLYVPQWQNPDEPAHLAVVRALVHHPDFQTGDPAYVAIQSEILESMAAHGWWNAYEEPLPEPFPRTFEQTPGDHLGDQSGAPRLYYGAAAVICRLLGVGSLAGQYYTLRVVSLVLTLITFAVLIRACREWFDESVAYTAAALLVLIPEFTLIGISVSPDPLVFLAGALVWWQARRAFAGEQRVAAVVLMLAAAAVAVLSKQLGLTLFVQAAVLGGFAMLTTPWGRRLAFAVIPVVVVLRLAGVLRALTLLNPDQLAVAHRYRTMLEWSGTPLPLRYVITFTSRLFGTAYLSAGWLRFDPPNWVLTSAAAVFAVTLASGLALSASPRSGTSVRLATLVAALVVAIQVAAIYGTRYYLPDAGTQGRFLYPALGPLTAVCALGLTHWESRRVRAVLQLGTLGIMGMLNVFCWARTVVPAYAYWS